MNVCKPHICMDVASLTYECMQASHMDVAMHEAASVDHCLVHYTTEFIMESAVEFYR